MRVPFQTRESIAEDVRRLGVVAGEVLLLHSSLRSLGYVIGGPTAVIHALLDVLGPDGTVVVPAYTPENRDPSRWTNPVVPPELWPAVRDSIPAFDAALTPSATVGVIAERVRTWPGARRSAHPQTSFAAVGARAGEVTAEHALDSPLGERSPLAALEAIGARILLLGVGYVRCTAFHLAEYRQADPPRYRGGCAVATPAGRSWVTFETVALDHSDFAALGRDYEAGGGPVLIGPVGAAVARLLPIRDAVRYAEIWLSDHRRRARLALR